MSNEKQQALSEFGVFFNRTFVDMKELEALLSEKFQEEVDKAEDAQVAFDTLDDSVNGLLGKYFCYTLSESGETWHVGTGDEFIGSKLEDYLSVFRDHYGEAFQTLDDMCDKLEYRVMKDMSNAGCDAKTALRMILEEDLDLEDVFIITGADGPGRIEFVVI